MWVGCASIGRHDEQPSPERPPPFLPLLLAPLLLLELGALDPAAEAEEALLAVGICEYE